MGRASAEDSELGSGQDGQDGQDRQDRQDRQDDRQSEVAAGAKGLAGASAQSASRAGPESSSQAWRVDASLPVTAFMRRDVVYLRDNMWVDAAVSSLAERGLRDAPVLDEDGRPVGVLYVDDVETEDSFAEAERGRSGSAGAREGDWQDDGDDRLTSALLRSYGLRSGFHLDGHRRLRVREVMVPYIPEISADASIASAALVMHDNQLDHVMVVGDDGRAVGTFSREELVSWLVEETSGRRVPRHLAPCLRDVMRPAIAVRRRASLFTARDLLTTHDRQALPVVEGGTVVGMVLEADVYGLLAAHRDDDGWMQELLVEDVMRPAPRAFSPDTPVERVKDLLWGASEAADAADHDCLLVEQEGRLIGLVTAQDLGDGAETAVAQLLGSAQVVAQAQHEAPTRPRPLSR